MKYRNDAEARLRMQKAYELALARIDWLLWTMDLPWWKRLPVVWTDKLRYRLISQPARWLGWDSFKP